MPSSPSNAPSDAPAGTGLSTRTKWILGLVVLLGAGVFVLASWRSWQYQHWANAADQQEFFRKIQASSDPRLDERLLDVVKDDSKATSVRRAAASLLIDRNHQRDVEELLLSDAPRAQRIALAALSLRSWFHKEYLQRPEYRVPDVLIAWISDADAPAADRADAMTNVLPRVWPYAQPVPPQVLKVVSDVLAAPPSPDRDGPALRVAAAGVVGGYRHCPAVPALLAAAQREPDAVSRLRMTQTVVALYDGTGAPCKDALAEDAVIGLVTSALAQTGSDDFSRALRMGALSLLERHPAWAVKSAADVRRILESDAHPAERSDAMSALIATAKRPGLEDVAAWFHDAAPSVRSRIARGVADSRGGFEPAEHLSLLVGYLGLDPEPTDLAFHAVAVRLRTIAGSWIGFPEGAATQPGAATGDMGGILRDLVAGKSPGGRSRADIGAAWWNWLAGKNGVTGDVLKTAFAARDAFWAKAKSGDVAGARAALDGAPAKDSPLWEYERGFLAARAKKP
jgi:hypothetical protein